MTKGKRPLQSGSKSRLETRPLDRPTSKQFGDNSNTPSISIEDFYDPNFAVLHYENGQGVDYYQWEESAYTYTTLKVGEVARIIKTGKLY